MAPETSGRRPRTFVPFEVGSFLRAPYGWTMRMRQEEGYGGSRSGQQVRLGRWANVALAFLVYGPVVIGAVVGWRLWGGWAGAGVGAGLAFVAQLTVWMTLLPVFAFAQERRKSRRAQDRERRFGHTSRPLPRD